MTKEELAAVIDITAEQIGEKLSNGEFLENLLGGGGAPILAALLPMARGWVAKLDKKQIRVILYKTAYNDKFLQNVNERAAVLYGNTPVAGDAVTCSGEDRKRENVSNN